MEGKLSYLLISVADEQVTFCTDPDPIAILNLLRIWGKYAFGIS